MKKILSLIGNLGILGLLSLILYKPKICLESAMLGIILCGRVIIPSLYPFTFCVLFILKSDILNSLKFKYKIFGLDPQMFTVFLLSLIGGYPLGAKMLSDSQIDRKTASVMLNYCVNAGPAFIILAVGNAVFSSTKVGILLYISHIIPSFVLAFLFKKRIKIPNLPPRKKEINIIDNFVLSASESAATLINICSFVILFSVIIGYINLCPILSPISLILEVSNAVTQTQNIYLISALLGFGGVCIWCQVFSLSKGLKINYFTFILSRIFHGALSSISTFILLKILGPTLPTLSNGKSFSLSAFFQGYSVGISLLITGLVLIISLTPKNFAGNIREDIV